jgi:tetratricopeptide (TPR) repeat protein
MICSRAVLATASLFLFTASGVVAQRVGNGRNPLESTAGAFVVHGSVVLPDNVISKRIVRVEKVCGHEASGLVFADAKGHYSFDLGVINNQVEAASHAPVLAQGQRAANFADCSIRASLDGFRGEPIAIGALIKSRRAELPPIVLKPLAKDINSVISATDGSVSAPANKEYDRGLDLVAIGKWKDAIKAIEKGAAADPKFATARLSLGVLQFQQKEIEAAGKSYTKAIAADEHFATPYVELAVVESGSNDWEKVARHTAKAIELAPDSSPKAYYLNTMANIRLKKMDAALKSSNAGVSADPDRLFPDLLYMNGILLARTSDKGGAVRSWRLIWRSRLMGRMRIMRGPS